MELLVGFVGGALWVELWVELCGWGSVGGALWVELFREQHNSYLCISSIVSGPFGSLLSRLFTISIPMNSPKPLNKREHTVLTQIKRMIQSSARNSILGIYGWIQLSASRH